MEEAGIMFLLSKENEKQLQDPCLCHFTSFLAGQSLLEGAWANLQLLHPVLARGVKCFHVGFLHIPQKPGEGKQNPSCQASKETQVPIWGLLLLVTAMILVGAEERQG